MKYCCTKTVSNVKLDGSISHGLYVHLLKGFEDCNNKNQSALYDLLHHLHFLFVSINCINRAKIAASDH